MICKASQRGGGNQLAAHLLNAHDNERVEVAEIRGSVAKDLAGAFKEWHAQSSVTNCRKYLYSLSINPDQRQGHMTRAQYFELIGRFEKSLGLAERGRAIVFHEKKDRDGVVRQHCHVVWSRIDAQRGRAVTISFDRLKRLAIARSFAKELGRTVPEGMEMKPGPQRYARRAANSNHAEKQQEERSGITKEQRRADITEAWQRSKDGPAFVAALKHRGYRLIRGGRLSYAVVDRAGNVHGLGTQVKGVLAAEVKARLALSHPLDSLPDADTARREVAEQREKLRALPEAKKQKPAGPTPEERRAALRSQQEERRQTFIDARQVMEARHAQERIRLTPATSQGALQRLASHFHPSRKEDRALLRAQKAERRDFARQERNLTAVEKREQRSLETHIKRDDFQHYTAALRDLVPVLDRLSDNARRPEKITPPTLRETFSETKEPERQAPAANDDADVQRAIERARQLQEQQRQHRKQRPD